MTAPASLTDVFTRERSRLVGLAYRVTGSRLDAEDIVQDAWLRAQRVDWSDVERPEAWLTTVVSRLALDELRSARRRRETYVGPWLPEPVRTPGGPTVADVLPAGPVGPATADGDGEAPAVMVGGADAGRSDDPAAAVELAETLTFGFLRVLDALAPIERVVFLLADVFDTPYREIGVVVDRSPEACRQIASRARRRVRSSRLPHDPPENMARAAYALLGAVMAGDVDQVVGLLDEDVVLLSDGGADRYAARRPVRGPLRVARFMVNISRREMDGAEVELTSLNGEPGVVVRVGGRLRLALSVEVSEGAVTAVHAVSNPEKLAALDVTTPLT
jgi:RNA polymerase sigma-70 factor, ECF subfamily